MFYRRYLPHWQPDDTWIFVTWRLAGSLPKLPDVLSPDLPEGKRFVLLDADADRATTGPLWLKDPRIANLVKTKILELDGTLYELAAWVIMANHVHVVILPSAPLPRIMQSLKGATSRQANEILHRTGPFWAPEFYDHAIRSPRQLNAIIHYVEGNPVKAGIVDAIEHYEWSSARAFAKPQREPSGQPPAREWGTTPCTSGS